LAVRPPRSANTWSLAIIAALAAPNSSLIMVRKAVVRIGGQPNPSLMPGLIPGLIPGRIP
jgi:hypothetical protein